MRSVHSQTIASHPYEIGAYKVDPVQSPSLPEVRLVDSRHVPTFLVVKILI